MATESRRTLMGRVVQTPAPVRRILATQPAPQPEGYERRPHALMFTDIVGSTAYFEQRGDLAGMDMLERHNAMLLPLVEAHAGRVVKTIGDAIMAAWPDAPEAARCAVAMQERLAAHNAAAPSNEGIKVRIGLHYGSVVCQAGDLFGDVVNAAARVEGLAGPGEILLAAPARERLPDDLGERCTFFDAVRVKGKREPIEVFELRWDATAPAAKRLPPLPAGARLAGGRYEVCSVLGAGGMGRVYQARDHSLELDLALKFLHPEVASQRDALERFKAEVRLARTLSHPNVCRIHDFVRSDGQVYLSMEWVRGETLEEVLARGPLSPDEALPILHGVCAGLQAAHEHGIVHRDLKPANVMLERDTERVVLMDFGIAQLADTGATPDDARVLGTPEYMAPEQVLGDNVGPRADVYALGVLMYEMLSGDVPHRGATPVETATRHLEATPRALGEIVPGLPQRWSDTVARCLQRRAQDRPASPLDVLEDVRPPPPWWTRRWVLVAAVLLTLGLVAGAVGLAARGGRPAGMLAVQSSSPLVASRALEQWPRWAGEGDSVFFVRGGRLWESQHQGQEQPWGPAVRPQTAEGLAGVVAEPDGEHVLVAARGPDGAPAVLRVSRLHRDQAPEVVLERAAGVDLSPDGRWLAFVDVGASGHYGVGLARPDGAERSLLVPAEASRSYLQPRFAPDGQQLALVIHQIGYTSTRDVAVYPLPAGPLRAVTHDGLAAKQHNSDPAWGPGGGWLVYASKRSGLRSLWQVPAGGGESLPLTSGAVAPQRAPDLKTGGGHLLVASEISSVDIALRRVSGGPLRLLTEDPWLDRFPVFSPDGAAIVFRSGRRSTGKARRHIVVRRLEDSSSKQLPAPRGLRDFCWCGPAHLAYAATVDSKRILGLMDLSDGTAEVLVSGFHRLWSPTCSADGRRVVFGGRSSAADGRQLWLLDGPHAAVRALTAAPGVASYPVMHPSAATVAYRWAPAAAEMGQAELRLLDLGGDAEPQSLARHSSLRRSLRRLRFAQDGAHIYYLEQRGRAGQLWRAPVAGGSPEALVRLSNVHTFDFDVSPDGASVIYPRIDRRGDVYVLDLEPGDG